MGTTASKTSSPDAVVKLPMVREYEAEIRRLRNEMTARTEKRDREKQMLLAGAGGAVALAVLVSGGLGARVAAQRAARQLREKQQIWHRRVEVLEKEVAKEKRFAVQGLTKELLTVTDNLELCLRSMRHEEQLAKLLVASSIGGKDVVCASESGSSSSTNPRKKTIKIENSIAQTSAGLNAGDAEVDSSEFFRRTSSANLSGKHLSSAGSSSGSSVNSASVQHETLKSLLDGVELTEKSLLHVLGKYGVTPIEATPLESEFDPNVHEAMYQKGDVESNKIAQVERRGFYLHDRVLRPTRVAVGSQKPTSSTIDEQRTSAVAEEEEKRSVDIKEEKPSFVEEKKEGFNMAIA
ncbi:unnamed protein product [Amoebophrya sp. A25]|nr:unnamed protein product [Amoebophrya sp. A25]|eukprot:GSA25T00003097001.1